MLRPQKPRAMHGVALILYVVDGLTRRDVCVKQNPSQSVWERDADDTRYLVSNQWLYQSWRWSLWSRWNLICIHGLLQGSAVATSISCVMVRAQSRPHFIREGTMIPLCGPFELSHRSKSTTCFGRYDRMRVKLWYCSGFLDICQRSCSKSLHAANQAEWYRRKLLC